jgi:hypothetical protein
MLISACIVNIESAHWEAKSSKIKWCPALSCYIEKWFEELILRARSARKINSSNRFSVQDTLFL